jgi:hypothetical protein
LASAASDAVVVLTTASRSLFLPLSLNRNVLGEKFTRRKRERKNVHVRCVERLRVECHMRKKMAARE